MAFRFTKILADPYRLRASRPPGRTQRSPA